MDCRALLDFLSVAEKLKCNTRHSYTSSGRKESVAEHSWRLTLMASLMKDEYPDMDISKVMRMCLFHDLGEAVTGDIPSFIKTAQDEDVEKNAVDELLALLPEPTKQDTRDLFAEMNELKTPEAKLYKALDKLEVLIQHNEADIATWLPLEYDLQLVYGESECDFSRYTKALRRMVKEDTENKIKQSRETERA